MIADIVNTLASATATDLRPLQIKITYVGTQKKTVPTVAFTTFHHLLVLDWFPELRAPGLRDGDNGIAVWNFVVTPEEMSRAVKALATPDLLPETHDAGDPCLSVMASVRGSRIGTLGFEAVLDRDHCIVLMETLGRVFGSNQLASHVIAQQKLLVCP